MGARYAQQRYPIAEWWMNTAFDDDKPQRTLMQECLRGFVLAFGAVLLATVAVSAVVAWVSSRG